MKKLLLSTLLAVGATGAFAQAIVTDSVSLGAGYANQVWYSMKNDEQRTEPKNNWDLAFNLKDINSSILINSSANVSLWGYPKADLTGWGSVDTSGLSTWPLRYNTDTSWAYGAMGRYMDADNWADVDWGIYDLTTHEITGDSLYIIKLGNGSYKKLAIVSLISGVFTFKYADLNGSNEQTKTLKKGDYSGKLLAYYSIQNNQPLDREPLSGDWDILFTQYIDMAINYNVTGVLHNRGVAVAEVTGVADVNTYSNWSVSNYTSNISEIGYNWKSFDMNTNTYTVKPSHLYIVMTQNDEYWKIVFTGFSSATGKFNFTKQRIFSVGVQDKANALAASMTAFPNPASGSATVVYTLEKAATHANLMVYDMAGKVVYNGLLETTAGMHQHTLPLGNILPGNYVLHVNSDLGRMQQILTVR